MYSSIKGAYGYHPLNVVLPRDLGADFLEYAAFLFSVVFFHAVSSFRGRMPWPLYLYDDIRRGIFRENEKFLDCFKLGFCGELGFNCVGVSEGERPLTRGGSRKKNV